MKQTIEVDMPEGWRFVRIGKPGGRDYVAFEGKAVPAGTTLVAGIIIERDLNPQPGEVWRDRSPDGQDYVILYIYGHGYIAKRIGGLCDPDPRHNNSYYDVRPTACEALRFPQDERVFEKVANSLKEYYVRGLDNR